MPLLYRIKQGFEHTFPQKSTHGLSSGHGPFDDDLIVPKAVIVFHASQIFFAFLALACFAGVASFQAKFGVGPSGLTGFALFVAVILMLLSAFLLLVPVIYVKYDKLSLLARTLGEPRVSFVLTGAGVLFSLLLAFITTISSFTQPGCKDPSKDPNAGKGTDFLNGLPGWCSTKRAGAIFFWLAFVFWAASFGYLFREWRRGNLRRSPTGPRDPPFTRPDEEEAPAGEDAQADDAGDETATSSYHGLPPLQISDPFSTTFAGNGAGGNPSTLTFPARNQSTSAIVPQTPDADDLRAGPPGRPSLDTYGAFSDPPPSGYLPNHGQRPAVSAAPVSPTGYGVPSGPPPGFVSTLPATDAPISRTMQYANPYAAVRARVESAANQANYGAAPPYPGPF